MNSKQKSTKNPQSLWNLFDEENVASLPYNGSSGWSGTDTSKERADYNDHYGKTEQIQAFIYRYLMWNYDKGATWREIADASGWHHGSISGALSVLHKDGKISRLLEKRGRCRVYVLNEYVSGRETDSQGRKPKECPNCGHHL
jgi:hypothetical protein